MNNIPEDIMDIQSRYCQEVPSVRGAHRFIEDLIRFLFPIKDNKKPGLKETRIKYTQLEIQLEELLKPIKDNLKRSPEALSEQFFSSLHPVFIDLLEEAESYLQNDPAAYNVEEILLPSTACHIFFT